MQAEAASSPREPSELLRILSVTHNLVDQMAVLVLLEKSGHCVEVVGNRGDALAALEDRRFDIVLVDIEPLEMDGAETVAAIRDREKVTGAHVPIIAVPSHALEQAREEYLGWGMDACVSKPIQVTELFRTIEILTKAAMEDSGQPIRHGPQILKPEGLSGTTPDKARLTPLAKDYAFTHSLTLLAQIQAAVRAGEVNTIRHAADALKGSITSVLAKEAFEAISTLEETVHEGDFARADDACRRLRAAISSLNPT